jgi:hypothetical protein
MLPLALGTAADFYLIARLILGAPLPALLLAVMLFAIYCTLWFVLPHRRARRWQTDEGRSQHPH